MMIKKDQVLDKGKMKWATSQEILEHGNKLLNKTLRTQKGIKTIPEDLLLQIVGVKQRGSIGTMLEEYYYDIQPGNEAVPDFKEAGVELKSTPVKKLQSGIFSAKERLVLGVINYLNEANVTFEESSFYIKNKSIMLLSYLHEKDKVVGDLKFKISKLLVYENFSEEDKKIIRSDWEKINKKIRDGKAHELSEGDTLYLAACTKSATSKNRRPQNNGPDAKPRAYSYKPGYMTYLTRQFLGTVDDKTESVTRGDNVKDFEKYIVNKFSPYIGMSTKKLLEKFKVDTVAKSKYAILANRILGVNKQKIEEFEKANIKMKTIQLKHTGMPKEAMSFPSIKFNKFIEEDWDDEENVLRGQLEQKFFFVIFRCNKDCEAGDSKFLEKVMFWNMPATDIDGGVKNQWDKMQNAVRLSNVDKFPKSSDGKIVHIRPHGRNSEDVDILPNGESTTKRCFWINQNYLKEVVKENK